MLRRGMAGGGEGEEDREGTRSIINQRVALASASTLARFIFLFPSSSLVPPSFTTTTLQPTMRYILAALLCAAVAASDGEPCVQSGTGTEVGINERFRVGTSCVRVGAFFY